MSCQFVSTTALPIDCQDVTNTQHLLARVLNRRSCTSTCSCASSSAVRHLSSFNRPFALFPYRATNLTLSIRSFTLSREACLQYAYPWPCICSLSLLEYHRVVRLSSMLLSLCSYHAQPLHIVSKVQALLDFESKPINGSLCSVCGLI